MPLCFAKNMKCPITQSDYLGLIKWKESDEGSY